MTTTQVEHYIPIPEVGDYVKLWEFDHPETTNFAVVSEYCWSEASIIHNTVYMVKDERGAILTVVRLKELDTHQHRGWQHIAYRISDGMFRQYLDNEKEKQNA